MRRRTNSALVIGICASLWLHALGLDALLWTYIKVLEAGMGRPALSMRVGPPTTAPTLELQAPDAPDEMARPADAPAPQVVELPQVPAVELPPAPKPDAQLMTQQFGEHGGKGKAVNSSPGAEPMQAYPTPDEQQAPLRVEPLPPQAMPDRPSISSQARGEDGEGGNGKPAGASGPQAPPRPQAPAAQPAETAAAEQPPLPFGPFGPGMTAMNSLPPQPAERHDPAKPQAQAAPPAAAPPPAEQIAIGPLAPPPAAAPPPVAPAPRTEQTPPAAPRPKPQSPAAAPPPQTAVAAPGGTPGTPGSSTIAPGTATPSDSESDPFSEAHIVAWRNGRVDARDGRKVRTVNPRLTLAGEADLVALNFPTVVLGAKIDVTGRVTDVFVLHSSGSNQIDHPTCMALWKWWFEPLRDSKGHLKPDAVIVPFSWVRVD